jgi:hypothetical protein
MGGMGKCVNNCGFFGNEQTNNYCSKCFAETGTKEAMVVDDDSKQLNDDPSGRSYQKEQFNKSRCWECKKKIGLVGVKCRCNYVFCNVHRQPEDHNCDVDYLEISKQNLSKHNPVVIGSKIEKI